jgi:DNA-binding beta-propeller fold protein YncE
MPTTNALTPPSSRPFPRLRRRPILAALVALVALLTTVAVSPTVAGADGRRSSSVVVANRGSGDISVIDTRSLDVADYDLPGEAEPMYVSHDTRHDRVLVGDRASSTIVAFDDETYEVVGSVMVGDGVFHQWLDVQREQLWVVGTSSNSVSVVDTEDLDLIMTIPMPADLVDRGGVPHDVFVSKNHAFVSILGLDDGTGAVVQYSTKTLSETGRISTGDDPHLFVRANKLYVASQNGSSVSRFNAETLRPLGSIDVPAAHGIFVTQRNEVLVTNIAGGGTDAVWELNHRLTAVEDVTDTSVPVPHNLTVDNRRQVWVTHSGATADQVSVIQLNRRGFGSSATVTVGINPFGLAFVK